MYNATRIVVLTFAALMLLGALAIAGDAAAGGAGAALIPALIAGAIIIVVVMERSRYRSETADRAREDPGPGGGEPGTMEPRFRATNEVFRDPTSGRLMRVYLDARTGERRYLAEQ